MLFILGLIFSLIAGDGHTYDDSTYAVLNQVKKDTTTITIRKEVKTIKGGSQSSSAFSLCINTIEEVSFAEGSQITSIPEYLFYESKSLVKIDFTNALNLEIIPSYCFRKCSVLNDVKLPPSLKKVSLLFNKQVPQQQIIISKSPNSSPTKDLHKKPAINEISTKFI